MKFMAIICILLPLVSGVAMLLMKKVSAKGQKTFSFVFTLLTSLSVVLVMVFGRNQEFTILKFTDTLSFSLKPDNLGLFFGAMVGFLWPFATFYAFEYMKHDKNPLSYYAFYLMTYGVVLGVAFSANALSMYVFYEMLTFITLPLITHTETKEARKAGRLYLYYSLSGSSLALAGIVIMIVTTGSCSFVFGGNASSDTNLTILAYVLTFFGFGVKAAIFPLCKWLPLASAAPTPTTALLHAVAVVKSGAFAIIRMTYFMMPLEIIKGSIAQYIAVAVCALTVIYGSAMSVKEQHFKRRFAYSTISNLSYILLAVCMMSTDGLNASLVHFIMHSITKIGIFFCCGAIIETLGAEYVYESNGLGKKAPIIFISFTLSGLSLIGIPPFCGFVSKYYLISAFIKEGNICGYIGIGAIIISAILTAYYVLSVSFRAFVRTPNELSQKYYDKADEPSSKFTLVTSFFAVVSLLVGLFGSQFIELISNIVGGFAS